MVPHPPPSLSKRFLTLRHDASQYVWEILIGCLARKTRDGSSFVSATNRRGNMQRSEVRAPTTYRPLTRRKESPSAVLTPISPPQRDASYLRRLPRGQNRREQLLSLSNHVRKQLGSSCRAADGLSTASPVLQATAPHPHSRRPGKNSVMLRPSLGGG